MLRNQDFVDKFGSLDLWASLVRSDLIVETSTGFLVEESEEKRLTHFDGVEETSFADAQGISKEKSKEIFKALVIYHLEEMS